jgi:penicillin-binding protein 2
MMQKRCQKNFMTMLYLLRLLLQKNPELVVAIVVENGGSGSKTAAPIARTLIDYHFGTGEVDESKD